MAAGSRIAVEITGESASLQAAVAKAADSLKGLGDVLAKQTDAALGMGDKTVRMNELVAKSYQQMSSGLIVSSRDSIAALDRQATAAKASADEQVAASERTATAHVASAKKSEAAFGSASSSLTKAGKMISLGLIGAAAASVDLAVKFQANTLRMQTQAGATTAQLQKLRQGLLDMAQTVGFTPDQLATGMYHVVSSLNAVLPASQRVSGELKVMKAAAELARVGNSNLEDTTYALASAMNALHIPIKDTSKAAGQLNAIVGAGDMTMQDLVDTFKSGLLPGAREAGLSLQSVGAALAVMGDMGMRGALAGTRLRMSIALLSSPSEAAAKVLETLGLSAQQATSTSAAMADALEKAGLRTTQLGADLHKPNGLAVALEDLNNHLRESGLTATGAAAVMNKAFGGGRMGATITLLAENTGRLSTKFNQIGHDSQSFSVDFQRAMGTTKGQLDATVAGLAAMATRLGTDLLPTVNHAIHDFQDFVAWLEKGGTAAHVLEGTIGALATVAIGSYLVSKLKMAVQLVKDLRSGFQAVTGFGARIFGTGGGVVASSLSGQGGGIGGIRTAGMMPGSRANPIVTVVEAGDVAGLGSQTAGGLGKTEGEVATAETAAGGTALAAVKSGLSEGLSRALKGGAVAGIGIAGSQLAGGLIGGKTGAAVSSVGSTAAAGAGIGTLLGPGGTAIGGLLGGIVGLAELGGTPVGDLHRGGGIGSPRADMITEQAAAYQKLRTQVQGLGGDLGKLSPTTLREIHDEAVKLAADPSLANERRGLLDLAAATTMTSSQFAAMVSHVSASVANMKVAVSSNSQQAAQIGSNAFNALATNIASYIGSGAEATSKGLKSIVDEVNAALKKMGQQPLSAIQIQAATPAQLAALVTGQVSAGGFASPHATGGRVTSAMYMVGEETPSHPEYVLATNPAYRSRNLGLWAQAGSELGVPGFAQGGIVAPAVRGSGGLADVVRGAMNTDVKAAMAFLGMSGPAALNAPGGGGGVSSLPVQISGSLQSWLTAGMALAGVSGALWLPMLSRQAMRESTGNPGAVNNWDINAQHGDPSEGLLQTTLSTFAQYHVPGHDNILNPIDNTAAAIRYMIAAYGGGNANQAVQVMWARGGGAYALGTRGTTIHPPKVVSLKAPKLTARPGRFTGAPKTKQLSAAQLQALNSANGLVGGLQTQAQNLTNQYAAAQGRFTAVEGQPQFVNADGSLNAAGIAQHIADDNALIGIDNQLLGIYGQEYTNIVPVLAGMLGSKTLDTSRINADNAQVLKNKALIADYRTRILDLQRPQMDTTMMLRAQIHNITDQIANTRRKYSAMSASIGSSSATPQERSLLASLRVQLAGMPTGSAYTSARHAISAKIASLTGQISTDSAVKSQQRAAIHSEETAALNDLTSQKQGLGDELFAKQQQQKDSKFKLATKVYALRLLINSLTSNDTGLSNAAKSLKTALAGSNPVVSSLESVGATLGTMLFDNKGQFSGIDTTNQGLIFTTNTDVLSLQNDIAKTSGDSAAAATVDDSALVQLLEQRNTQLAESLALNEAQTTVLKGMIPGIPAYAQGGPVLNDTLAQVHGGEYVVPKGGTLVSGGGSSTIEFHQHLNGDPAMRALMSMIDQRVVHPNNVRAVSKEIGRRYSMLAGAPGR